MCSSCRSETKPTGRAGTARGRARLRPSRIARHGSAGASPSRMRTGALVVLLALLVVASARAQHHDHDHGPSTQPAETTDGRRVLRVASDPNNLPFSNDRGEGFENKIAELVARELGAELRYVWRAQRRGFCRETLKEGDRKSTRLNSSHSQISYAV